MSALARWRPPALPRLQVPVVRVVVDAGVDEPAEGPAVELAARALAAAQLGDAAAAGRVMDRMLADPWWGPVVEAAIMRALGSRGATPP